MAIAVKEYASALPVELLWQIFNSYGHHNSHRLETSFAPPFGRRPLDPMEFYDIWKESIATLTAITSVSKWVREATIHLLYSVIVVTPENCNALFNTLLADRSAASSPCAHIRHLRVHFVSSWYEDALANIISLAMNLRIFFHHTVSDPGDRIVSILFSGFRPSLRSVYLRGLAVPTDLAARITTSAPYLESLTIVGVTSTQSPLDNDVQVSLPYLHTLVLDTREEPFSVSTIFRHAACPRLRYLGVIQRLALGRVVVPFNLNAMLRTLDLTECHRTHLSSLALRDCTSLETLIVPLRFAPPIADWTKSDGFRGMKLRYVGLVRMMWDSSHNISSLIADDLQAYTDRPAFPRLKHIRVFRVSTWEFSRSVLHDGIISTHVNKIRFDNHEGRQISELLTKARSTKVTRPIITLSGKERDSVYDAFN